MVVSELFVEQSIGPKEDLSGGEIVGTGKEENGEDRDERVSSTFPLRSSPEHTRDGCETYARWNSRTPSRSRSLTALDDFVSSLTSSFPTTSASREEGRGGVDPSNLVCSNEPPSALHGKERV